MRAWAWRLGLATLLVTPTLAACHPPESVAPTKPRRKRHPRPKVAPTVAQILAASELPPLRPEADPDDPMGVTVHRLSNGLTVYVSPDPSLRKIETAVAVRAGARHDPRDATGLAHYLEHMLFKGSDDLGTTNIGAERPHLETIAALYAELRQTKDPDRRAEILTDIDRETVESSAYSIPNELDRVYAGLGIEGVNAYTSDEVTAYVSTVPVHRFEAWARLEAERFIDAEFRLFWPELEAVYEEKNQALDSPEDRVWQAVRQGLFPDHPYGTNDILGTSEHLKNPAFLEMTDYYRRWYAPNNAAIFLVGDVDADVVVPVLEEAFATWRPRSLPTPDGGTIGPPAREREIEVEARGAQSVTLAWRTVPVAHEDAAALQVMDLLMDNARTGLLNVKLGLPQVVPSVGSWGEQLNESGYWVVSAQAKDGQNLDVVEKLLLAVVEDLREGAFDPADLEAVVLNERIARTRLLESPEARVELMIDGYMAKRPWPAPLDDVEQLAEVSKADIVRVAGEYLDDDFVSVRRVSGTPELPGMTKPPITAIDIDVERRSEFARRLVEAPFDPPAPRWIERDEDYWIQRGRGAQRDLVPALVAAPNERNDLFAMDVRWDRGYRESPLLCLSIALLEVSGRLGEDGPVSAEVLRRELYGLGAEVSFHCDAESTVVSLRGPATSRDRALTLVRAWMTRPLFDADTLDALRENIRTDRLAAIEDPQRMAWALRDFARYGPKSAWLAQPSNRELDAATPKKLERELGALRRYAAQVIYFGPHDGASPPDVALFDGRRDSKLPPRRRFRGDPGVQIFVVDAPVAKSIVHVTMPAGTRPPSEHAAAELYGQYLDGDMSSLLFQEVREARGLAYAVSGHVSTGSRREDAWALTGSLGTQTDKTVEAIALYLDLVRPDPETGLDEARLDVARASLDGAYRTARIDPRAIPEVVAGWTRIGYEGDPRRERWQALADLDGPALLELATDWTDGPVLISVVGNVDELDMAGLRALGEVLVVEPDTLFGFGSFERPVD